MVEEYFRLLRSRQRRDRWFSLYVLVLFGSLYGIPLALSAGTLLAGWISAADADGGSALVGAGIYVAGTGTVMLAGSLKGPMVNDPFAVWLMQLDGKQPPAIIWRLMRGRIPTFFAVSLMLAVVVLLAFMYGMGLGQGQGVGLVLCLLVSVTATASWVIGQLSTGTPQAAHLPAHVTLAGVMMAIAGLSPSVGEVISLNTGGPAAGGLSGLVAVVAVLALVWVSMLCIVVRRVDLGTVRLIVANGRARDMQAFVGDYASVRTGRQELPVRVGRQSRFASAGPVQSLRIQRLRRIRGASGRVVIVGLCSAAALVWGAHLLSFRGSGSTLSFFAGGLLVYSMWKSIGSNLALARELSARRPVLGWRLPTAVWRLNRDVLWMAGLFAFAVFAVCAIAQGMSSQPGYAIAAGTAVGLAFLASSAEDLAPPQHGRVPYSVPSPFGDLGGVLFVVSSFSELVVLACCMAAVWGAAAISMPALFTVAFLCVACLLTFIATRLIQR